MKEFDLCIPTKILYGTGRGAEIGTAVSEYGKTALLITYSEQETEKIGALPGVLGALEKEGIKPFILFGVKSNPSVQLAREAIEIARRERIEVIVALGGGSVIDTAKCVAAGMFYDGDVWDLFEYNVQIHKALPIVTVVTMPASSSEMNCGLVMDHDSMKRKQAYVNKLLYPKISILDPELTYKIPIRQTAYSAVDIVSHLLEAYISHTVSFAPMQNHYAEGMIKTIMECMARIMKDNQDIEARASFMWAATYAWNGFYSCGLGMFDQPIHLVGHVFSAYYDTPHGAAMAITIPAVMRYTIHEKTYRFAELARNVFSITETDDEKAAERCIELFIEWIEGMGVAMNMVDAGIPTDKLSEMAENIYQTSIQIGYGQYYTLEKCKDLLALCVK